MFAAYDNMLISEEKGLRNFCIDGHVLGYELNCRYPSYRGTFLSCIEGFELYIDGQRVTDEKVNFILNGKVFTITELKDLFAEYWFVLDEATLRVWEDGGLDHNACNVEIVLTHRIPYTGYFGEYIVLQSKDQKRLEVVSGGGSCG